MIEKGKGKIMNIHPNNKMTEAAAAQDEAEGEKLPRSPVLRRGNGSLIRRGKLPRASARETAVGEMKKSRLLGKLFLYMLQISCFTFGGGFVIVTFMKRRFVDECGWLGDDEMLDMTAIAQASPGAIAVNAAIIVGSQIAGFAGLLVSVLGMILPPLGILSLVSYFYALFASNLYVALFLQGMQAGVAAVILDVVCSLSLQLRKTARIDTYVLFFLAFFAAFFLKVNVIWLVLGALLIGVAKVFVSAFPGKGNKIAPNPEAASRRASEEGGVTPSDGASKEEQA